MTSLFTRATISSTITLFVCAVTVPAARKSQTINGNLCFIGNISLAGSTRAHKLLMRSLSLRFKRKQHVSDTFGDPPAPLDAHPQRSARAQAHPLPLAPN